ncbi:MFS transporter, PPP family, 3-phenylpropionic acid transporter [Paenibacillus sp. 1_12]|uniref:MFS transporter n=1 Tax=Paenibacillus sp. 1_12 TaxID=1566278 RepID=UPI0008EE5F4A|nr:MFS transporter [Paenibacillus sp. 1_12]SFL67871.1 MFS transporter, PPP family, 3-phenylpropionic acid transporter [Paenibacillus sp. 1_12]
MPSKNVTILAIFYAFVYMSIGTFSSYIGIYMTEAGIGHSEIGVLTSIGAVIGLVAQPIWGVMSDRAKTKNRILMICTLCASLTVWLIPWAGTLFVPLLIAMALFSLFQIAINPLSDAITLELSSKGVVRFSSIRTFGSVGYAFVSVAAGWLFAEHLNTIFLVTSLIMFGCFLLSLGIPKVAGHQSGGKKVNLVSIFKNRQLVILYAYTLALSISMGFLFSFQAIYSKEQGISMEVIGIGLAIGSFSQFPFMIFFQRFYDRFGIRNILLFSGLIHTLRWFLYAFALTPFTYILSWVLHGGTYILFYMCLAEYVNTYVVKELKASGQMLNSLIQLSVGKIIGGMLGGVYAAQFGFQSAFLVLAVMGGLSTLAFYMVDRRYGVFAKPDISQL